MERGGIGAEAFIRTCSPRSGSTGSSSAICAYEEKRGRIPAALPRKRRRADLASRARLRRTHCEDRQRRRRDSSRHPRRRSATLIRDSARACQAAVYPSLAAPEGDDLRQANSAGRRRSRRDRIRYRSIAPRTAKDAPYTCGLDARR